MEIEPGEGWADAVSKILSIGKHSNKGHILAKAKRDKPYGSSSESGSDDEASTDSKQTIAPNPDYMTRRSKPQPQEDALLENDLKAVATRGVVHLFNVVKTVNPKSDKKRKKKKKKKNGRGKTRGRGRR